MIFYFIQLNHINKSIERKLEFFAFIEFYRLWFIDYNGKTFINEWN